MHNTELVKWLKTLEKDELFRFSQFVESAIIKRNSKGVQLLQIIQKVYPDWNSNALKEEKVLKKLFPDDGTNNNLKRLRSELLSQLKDYLIYLKVQQDQRKNKLLLLEVLLERGFFDQFKKELSKVKKVLNDTPERNAEYYFYQYRLEDLQRRFPYLNRKEKKKYNFQAFFDHFESFTLIEKLKYCCYAASVENIKQSPNPHDIFLRTELKNQLEGSKYLKDSPVIKIYFMLWRAFTEENTDLLFEEVEPLLSTSKDLLSEEEQKDLDNLIINYLVNRINASKEADKLNYLRKLFQWNKAIIDNGWVFEGEYIPHQRFKNIVGCALHLGEFDWIATFRDKHIQHVKPDDQDSLQDFITGAVNFYQNKFDEAIYELRFKATPKNDFYFYDINTLLLRAYYETGAYEEVRVIFQRLEKKLRRDTQTAKQHKTGYRNFSRNLLKLIKIQENLNLSKDQRQEKIQQLIDELAPIVVIHKDWLMKKVKQCKG